MDVEEADIYEDIDETLSCKEDETSTTDVPAGGNEPDLYDHIYSFETPREVQQAAEIKKLKTELMALGDKLEEKNSENRILRSNMESLLLTARKEITRKAAEITELQRTLIRYQTGRNVANKCSHTASGPFKPTVTSRSNNGKPMPHDTAGVSSENKKADAVLTQEMPQQDDHVHITSTALHACLHDTHVEQMQKSLPKQKLAADCSMTGIHAGAGRRDHPDCGPDVQNTQVRQQVDEHSNDTLVTAAHACGPAAYQPKAYQSDNTVTSDRSLSCCKGSAGGNLKTQNGYNHQLLPDYRKAHTVPGAFRDGAQQSTVAMRAQDPSAPDTCSKEPGARLLGNQQSLSASRPERKSYSLCMKSSPSESRPSLMPCKSRPPQASSSEKRSFEQRRDATEEGDKISQRTTGNDLPCPRSDRVRALEGLSKKKLISSAHGHRAVTTHDFKLVDTSECRSQSSVTGKIDSSACPVPTASSRDTAHQHLSAKRPQTDSVRSETVSSPDVGARVKGSYLSRGTVEVSLGSFDASQSRDNVRLPSDRSLGECLQQKHRVDAETVSRGRGHSERNADGHVRVYPPNPDTVPDRIDHRYAQDAEERVECSFRRARDEKTMHRDDEGHRSNQSECAAPRSRSAASRISKEQEPRRANSGRRSRDHTRRSHHESRQLSSPPSSAGGGHGDGKKARYSRRSPDVRSAACQKVAAHAAWDRKRRTPEEDRALTSKRTRIDVEEGEVLSESEMS